MKKNMLLLVVFFCLSISCRKNTVEANPEKTVSINADLNNELLLKLVNQVRTTGCNCGNTVMPPVPALTWSDQISLAASNHSKDMNKNAFFDHKSSDGKTLADRFNVVGYKWQAIAENIAAGQKDEQAVMSSWLNSEGHCKNIMGASYKEMGAAKVGKYWTQDFGTKRTW